MNKRVIGVALLMGGLVGGAAEGWAGDMTSVSAVVTQQTFCKAYPQHCKVGDSDASHEAWQAFFKISRSLKKPEGKFKRDFEKSEGKFKKGFKKKPARYPGKYPGWYPGKPPCKKPVAPNARCAHVTDMISFCKAYPQHCKVGDSDASHEAWLVFFRRFLKKPEGKFKLKQGFKLSRSLKKPEGKFKKGFKKSPLGIQASTRAGIQVNPLAKAPSTPM